MKFHNSFNDEIALHRLSCVWNNNRRPLAHHQAGGNMSYLGLNTTTDDHAAKASPADVRRKNRQLIFRLLFPTNQYSRAELGRRTGLSRVAVSDVVGRMLEEGLLRETGQAPSGGKGKLRHTAEHRYRSTAHHQHRPDAGAPAARRSHQSARPAAASRRSHPEHRLIRFRGCGSIELIEKMLGMSDGEVIGIGVASPGVVDNGVVPLLHDARLEQSRPVHANRRTFRT